IRSEAVYYLLHTDADGYEILRTYARRGVLAVSPITMSLAVELIARGIRDVTLNETAKEVRVFLQGLGTRFDTMDEDWRTYCMHFRHLSTKESDIDRRYKQLRQEFSKVMRDSQISRDGAAGDVK